MEGGLLDSGQGEEREQKKGYLKVDNVQKPSAAAAAGARELQAGGWYSLGSGAVLDMMEKVQKPSAAAAAEEAVKETCEGEEQVVKMIQKPSAAAAAGARELQAGGGMIDHAHSARLGSGKGKEKNQYSGGAGATSYSLGSAFLVLTIAYAFLVLYVTETYTHSWMEKLQMLPLCIVAVIPPMLWAIIFGKFHG